MTDGEYFGGTFAPIDRHNKATHCDMCDILWHLRICDDKRHCCASYRDAHAVQTSFSIWRRNPFTMRFVNTWVAACTRDTMKRSKYGDQTIMSLLVAHYERRCAIVVPETNATAEAAKNLNAFLTNFHK